MYFFHSVYWLQDIGGSCAAFQLGYLSLSLPSCPISRYNANPSPRNCNTRAAPPARPPTRPPPALVFLPASARALPSPRTVANHIASWIHTYVQQLYVWVRPYRSHVADSPPTTCFWKQTNNRRIEALHPRGKTDRDRGALCEWRRSLGAVQGGRR